MKIIKYLIGVFAASTLIAIEYYLINSDNLRDFLIVLTLILSSLPYVVQIILEQRKQSEKESKFIEFLRDLVEEAKTGTPVIKGIINVQNRDYGSLSPHVKKLANQIVLGIPLSSALETFSKDSKSIVISRAVTLISEAQKAGGRIETILESISNSVSQIENLKKERKSSVSNLVTQGYIIFIIFIAIMLLLEFKVLPLTKGIGGPNYQPIGINPLQGGDLASPLFYILIIQSVFTGLVIGKISEGELKRGIKHSFILLAITLLVTTGSRLLFKSP